MKRAAAFFLTVFTLFLACGFLTCGFRAVPVLAAEEEHSRSGEVFILVADDESVCDSAEKTEELTKKWEADGFRVISLRDVFRKLYGIDEAAAGEDANKEADMDADKEADKDAGGYRGIDTQSPEWVGKLEAAASADQMLVVAAFEEEATTAWISLHEKQEDETWHMVMTTPGFIGLRGLGKTKEGDLKTPVGVYRFNRAFGVADDPGCAIPYVKVDEDTYWSGDQREGFRYNELVSLKELPGLDLKSGDSEHIIDYPYHYRYCLNISYNEEGTPGLGSAIFLHCFGPAKPYTGGCVSVPEDHMKFLMQRVDGETAVVIDTYEKLSGGAAWPDSTWPKER